MIITLYDMVAESDTDILVTDPDITFREWNNGIHGAIQYALAFSIIDHPILSIRTYGKIFWLQNPFSLLVNHTEAIAPVIVDDTAVIMEHKSLRT